MQPRRTATAIRISADAPGTGHVPALRSTLNQAAGSDKQSTPLEPELLNLPVNVRHRHAQLPGQAGLA